MSFHLKHSDLHETRNYPRRYNVKVNQIINSGRVWVKKANMYLRYINYNTKDKTDIAKWE